MSKEPTVRVQIFGTEYQNAASVDPEHTREVAKYIDRKMREIANSLSLRSVAKIAVLTAVNLADEMFKETENDKEFTRELDEKIRQLETSTAGKIV